MKRKNLFLIVLMISILIMVNSCCTPTVNPVLELPNRPKLPFKLEVSEGNHYFMIGRSGKRYELSERDYTDILDYNDNIKGYEKKVKLHLAHN